MSAFIKLIRRCLPSKLIPMPENTNYRRNGIARSVMERHGRYRTADQVDAEFEALMRQESCHAWLWGFFCAIISMLFFYVLSTSLNALGGYDKIRTILNIKPTC